MSLHGIQLAGRALQAHQRSLELTGQNIANASTPGYSRQVVALRPVGAAEGASTIQGGPQALGAGVDATVVVRAHASWLDRSADALSGQAGDATNASRLASQLEALTGEPGDSGLQASLDRFFSAFQGVADRPNDATARQTALQAGAEIGRRFQEVGDGIATLGRETIAGIGDGVTQVNALAKQVAALNVSIASGQGAGEPVGELQDQRDQLLADLTRLTGANVSGRDGGALVVSIGGITLVQGDSTQALTMRQDGSLALSDGTRVPVAGGEIGAKQRWAQTILPDRQSQIAGIRDALAQRVNSLHSGGRDRNGAAGVPFFVAQQDGDLAVNPALQNDPARVAAGDGSAGDGSVARAIAGLRETPELLPAYRTLISAIGSDAAQATRQDAIAQASLQQIQGMQASESGVNLDEELANMVAQQHVYAASARLLSTFDQMLDTLIQRTAA